MDNSLGKILTKQSRIACCKACDRLFIEIQVISLASWSKHKVDLGIVNTKHGQLLRNHKGFLSAISMTKRYSNHLLLQQCKATNECYFKQGRTNATSRFCHVSLCLDVCCSTKTKPCEQFALSATLDQELTGEELIFNQGHKQWNE